MNRVGHLQVDRDEKPDVTTNKEFGFAWSFQPILATFRIFGIHFNWGENQSATRRYLIWGSRVLWFAANIVNIVYSIMVEFREGLPIFPDELGKYFYVLVLVADHVKGMGLYCVIVLSTWRYGSKVVDAFQLIESRSQNNDEYFSKIRKVANIASLCGLITVNKI